ncbi:MAG: hypothetical protein WCJ58_04310 [bacterium]
MRILLKTASFISIISLFLFSNIAIVQARSILLPQPTANDTILVGKGVKANNKFGYSVKLSRNRLIAGSPYYTDSAIGMQYAGAAHIYELIGNSWIQTAVLTASDAEAGDQLGTAVAISGDNAIAGAYLEDHNRVANNGAAYVFKQTDGFWSETAKLIAPDNNDDLFGLAVAISDNFAIVGQPGLGNGGSISCNGLAQQYGAVYVYEISKDSTAVPLQQKIVAPDAQACDYFGISVAISGETLAIGATQQGMFGATGTGKIYIYKLNSHTGQWELSRIIVPGNAIIGDNFGNDLALDNNTLVAGAWMKDNKNGSVYTFQNFSDPTAISDNDWRQTSFVSGETAARLGSGVDILGDKVIAGADKINSSGVSNGGYALILNKNYDNTWSISQKVTPILPEKSSWYAWAVAIDNNGFLVGAPNKTTPAGGSSGGVYVYSFPNQQIF